MMSFNPLAIGARAALATGAILLGLSLTGCVSAQLNHDTLEVADSVDQLSNSQILDNLARTITDPDAIPMEAAISGGTVATTNSITPTFSGPLSPMSAIASAIQTAVAPTGTTKTTTNTKTTTHPNFGFSVAANDLWTQGWSLVPVSDPDELRRLRALYRLATGKTDQQHPPARPGEPASAALVQLFECEYPIQRTATDQAAIAGDSYTSSCVFSGAGAPVITKYYPDLLFFNMPSCVLCESGAADPVLNPALGYGFIGDEALLKIDPNAITLGKHHGVNLYLCSSDACKREYHEFFLFLQEAMEQSGAQGNKSSPPPLGAPGIALPGS